jgi:BASS family bile acid:Na+ symporter
MPVLFGMLVLDRRPAVAARFSRPLLNVSTGLLLLLILGLMVQTWGSEYDMTGLALRATPSVVLLLLLSTGLGMAGARALGVDAAATRSLALEIGVQNVNLALVVAISLLGEPRYAGTALIYLPVMMVVAGAVIAWGRRGPLERANDSRREAMGSRA